jgi:hypothetical protein
MNFGKTSQNMRSSAGLFYWCQANNLHTDIKFKIPKNILDQNSKAISLFLLNNKLDLARNKNYCLFLIYLCIFEDRDSR